MVAAPVGICPAGRFREALLLKKPYSYSRKQIRQPCECNMIMEYFIPKQRASILIATKVIYKYFLDCGDDCALVFNGEANVIEANLLLTMVMIIILWTRLLKYLRLLISLWPIQLFSFIYSKPFNRFQDQPDFPDHI